MPFKFDKYTPDEAVDAARAFVEQFSDTRLATLEAGTADWTDAILNWFATTASAEVVVDATAATELDEHRARRPRVLSPTLADMAPSRGTCGESLFDLSHWSLPQYGRLANGGAYGTEAWWRHALTRSTPPRMLLALESEMGRSKSALDSYRMVMDDASKLLAASCRVKVVVFASTSPTNRRAILSSAQTIAEVDTTAQFEDSVAQRPTWVWLDLPWRVDANEEWRPVHHVFPPR